MVGALSRSDGLPDRGEWPSLTGWQLRRALERRLPGYRTVRQQGPHRRLEAEGRPPIVCSIHDLHVIRPRTVKRILCGQAGLSDEDAADLLDPRTGA